MSIRLYMDVHVRQAITQGLRLREVDVLTSQEDGTRRFSDPMLLDRAMALSRILFSRDEDLLREAARRQQRGEAFAGVIYAHQLKVTVGQCIRDLELLAHISEPEEFANRVEYLSASEVVLLQSSSVTGRGQRHIVSHQPSTRPRFFFRSLEKVEIRPISPAHLQRAAYVYMRQD